MADDKRYETKHNPTPFPRRQQRTESTIKRDEMRKIFKDINRKK